MHGDVAAHTFAAGLESQAAVRHLRLGMKSGVALQAELASLAPHEEHAVGTAVWVMAGHAAFHFYRGVFEDEWTALFHVAFHAGFRSRMVEAGGIFRAVRVVAVRTLDQALGNAMVLGQRELRLHRPVAGKARRGLSLLQEAVVQPAGLFGDFRNLEEVALRGEQRALALVLHFLDQVRAVALTAGNAVPGVGRVFEQFLLLAGGVAREAARGVLLGASFEGKYGMVGKRLGDFGVISVGRLHGVAVRFARAVAGLASANVIDAGENQMRVAGFFVFNGFRFVAVAASLRAGERAGRLVKLRRAAGNGWAVERFGALLRDAGGSSAEEQGREVQQHSRHERRAPARFFRGRF